MLNTSGHDLKFMLPTDVHSWQPSMEWVVHTPCQGNMMSRGRSALLSKKANGQRCTASVCWLPQSTC